MKIGSIKISGQSTKREWAVYLFVATPKNKSGTTKLYVGKVGDNRDGCNPVISRIGNHFSYNRIHSQIRNKIKTPEEYDYEYFYCHFGRYEDDKISRNKSRKRTNELERTLNQLIQKKISNSKKLELLNIYKGVGVSIKEKEQRKKLVSNSELELLHNLIREAL